MKQTLITIVPTRNRADLLRFTLQSLAAQTRKPDRVLILDNQSTDNTPEVLKEFSTMLPLEHRPSTRLLTWHENHNRGLEFASETRFLHFLHDDDLIMPGFCAGLSQALETGKGIGLAYCLRKFIDQHGNITGYDRPAASTEIQKLTPAKFIRDRAFFEPIYVPSILLRTDFQPAPCLFGTEFRSGADIIFWSQWASHCKDIAFVPEYLTHYRYHLGSLTSNFIRDLEESIDEEFAVTEGAVKILEKAFPEAALSWMEREKRKCILAARHQVTNDRLKREAPDQAARIPRHVGKTFGWRYWLAGKMAVRLRDIFRPKTD